jgi:hypothetical protein
MPALGCGLGNLQWQDVGPLMCKFLKELDIQVCIYLPTDGKIADELSLRLDSAHYVIDADLSLPVS